MHRWLRKLDRLKGESNSKRGLARRRPALEPLEDRCLLAGNFTEFLIPTAAPESPFGITTGSDGNLWFTEQDPKGVGDSIGRISTAGTAQLFKLPTSASLPGAITAGPDGALWFVEVQAGQIGRSATDGTMSEFALAKGSSPQDITVGPNGNLWFTNASLNQIGQITTKGVVSATPLSTTGFPLGLITGPDGNIWFTNPSDNSIETLQGSSAVEFSIPSGSSQPTRITVGSDNNLWFTESGSNKIGKIDPGTGAITEFALLTPGSGPFAITSGPDGALWFTEQNANRIGRITTSGQLSEFTIPTANSRPVGISSGPDGNIWFTEGAANKIGKFNVRALTMTGSGVAVCSFAGVALNNVPVATFIDIAASDVPPTYTATIDWGDGTPASQGVVSKTANGFTVTGSHNYAIEGDLSITVTVTRSTDGAILTINSPAMAGGFVTSLYREVLQRAPDAPGLNGWVHALNSGVARDFIAEAFWEAPEHRGLEVDQFYATFLHRAGDGPGRAGWINAMLSGVSENEVAIDFLISPEYTAAHADANSFVAGLYTGIFQRAGDAAGQAYWTSVVQSGLRSRAAVAYYFLTSTEAYLQAINSYYETFLGRAPSSQEAQNFVPILIHGATPGSIVALFLTSSEFINREIALACQGTGTPPG